jgi:non-heme chloroperoxidase
MPFVTAGDGAQICLHELGHRRSPVVLSHGWPLNSDA